MKENVKELLFSEKSMWVINALFFVSVLFRNRVFMIGTYSLWVVYICFSMKHTRSRVMKVVYSVWIAFAVTMILLNIFTMNR